MSRLPIMNFNVDLIYSFCILFLYSRKSQSSNKFTLSWDDGTFPPLSECSHHFELIFIFIFNLGIVLNPVAMRQQQKKQESSRTTPIHFWVSVPRHGETTEEQLSNIFPVTSCLLNDTLYGKVG